MKTSHRDSVPAITLRIAVFLLFFVPAASTAFTDPHGVFTAPSEGACYKAGSEIWIQWSPLSPEVVEFELLLILNDSAETKIRLTKQLEPDLVSYSWRVPSLPTRSAKIALRYSRGHGEVWGNTSGSFQIISAHPFVTPNFTYAKGEIWILDNASDHRFRFAPLAKRYQSGHPYPALPPFTITENNSSLFLSSVSEACYGGTVTPRSSEVPTDPRGITHRPAAIPQRE